MIVERTELRDVAVVRAPVHADTRGFFTETFHADRFASIGLPTSFAQDNHSRSHRNVLRGLHFQLEQPQGKLVRAVTGRIFDVAVDLRRSSPDFGRWVGVTLEAGDGRQLWIPPGFGHGFLVLSDVADVTYKCTTVYHAPSNRAIRWNDPEIGIRWPLPHGVEPTLSDADAGACAFSSQAWFE
ncbi:MAG TPA: dTDP-4-dehydrorhamnose 3,5-epimerase [Gemmatimonadaceae bacterium]|nr:dTDP-4-dehydrorhamnose 3,5-epimerase [Gemmatimonadaceae bacterium]